jgi:hypothetical protein
MQEPPGGRNFGRSRRAPTAGEMIRAGEDNWARLIRERRWDKDGADDTWRRRQDERLRQSSLRMPNAGHEIDLVSTGSFAVKRYASVARPGRRQRGAIGAHAARLIATEFEGRDVHQLGATLKRWWPAERRTSRQILADGLASLGYRVNTDAAAEVIGLSPRTIRRLRREGTPKPRKNTHWAYGEKLVVVTDSEVSRRAMRIVHALKVIAMTPDELVAVLAEAMSRQASGLDQFLSGSRLHFRPLTPQGVGVHFSRRRARPQGPLTHSE